MIVQISAQAFHLSFPVAVLSIVRPINSTVILRPSKAVELKITIPPTMALPLAVTAAIEGFPDAILWTFASPAAIMAGIELDPLADRCTEAVPEAVIAAMLGDPLAAL